jgi:hypothetical protein
MVPSLDAVARLPALTTKVRVEAWHLPPRLLTGVYFLNTGLSKAGADEATAAQLHGFASGTYPFLRKLDARQFTRLLSAAETAIGVALVLPVVPAGLAGAALSAGMEQPRGLSIG